MTDFNRRAFLGVAGLAAGAGVFGLDTSVLGVWAEQQASSFPDEILNPIEVSGEEAVPIIGRLPGARRMYVLPANLGEHHLVGSQVMTRIARPVETGNVHELVTFAGRTGSTMPRHMHLSSHAALLVMSGEVELELNDQRWRMTRGDFANLPPGTPHGWTMRSDRAQIALFTMNDRVGAAFVAMGAPHANTTVPASGDLAVSPGKLASASFQGDFQLAPQAPQLAEPQKVTNVVLPLTPGPYVIADGGGERFGGNTFLARNANTSGQFLFLITEGRTGRRRRRALPRAAFREFLRARWRDARLGPWQSGAAQDRRLLPGAAAQPPRLQADAGLQPVCGLPHAWHLRKLLHSRRPRPRWRRCPCRWG